MDRRNFIKAGSLITGFGMMSGVSRIALAGVAESPAGWRTFELKTQVDIPAGYGKTKIWLPIPRTVHGQSQKGMSNTWAGNFTTAAIYPDPVYGAQALYAEFDGTEPPELSLSSFVSTSDVAVDLKAPTKKATVSRKELDLHLKGTPSSPTDGIVLATAQKITKGQSTPMGKALAVYDWILENGVRDPNITGCGTGDVVGMLESGNISGKCADLNGLFVALVKSIGIPARDVYGIRVADSRYFKSVGKSGDISKGQHCRAEFYLQDFGWVPVDPADVLKVSLEEKVSMDSPQVNSERRRQFGSWEGNWVAYNVARDLTMNPKTTTPMEFFMYPRAETEKGVINHLDPSKFKYSILSAPKVA